VQGAAAVWRSADHGLSAFFWPERDYLRSFHFDDGRSMFDCGADPKGCRLGDTTTPDDRSAITSPSCFSCMPGGMLSVSADGDAPGTGIVWASEPFNTKGTVANSAVGGGLNNVVAGVLHAFSAENLATDLWNSEAQPGRDGGFMFAKFNPPVAANGRVYMATASNLVSVYGLRQWAKFLHYNSGPPASVRAGSTFSVSATFLNDGITTWHKGSFHLNSETDSDDLWGSDSFDIPADAVPGDEVTITLTLTAPKKVSAGERCATAPTGSQCDFSWRMNEQSVEFFGDATPVATITIQGANAPPPTPMCPVNSKGKTGICCEIAANGQCRCAYPPASCN